MNKLPPRLLVLIVLALVAFAVSCTTAKRVAVTGGPVAVAGGVGALGGPVVAAVAAGATAVVMMLTLDNGELRSGETMSETQIEKEIARWKGLAAANAGRAVAAELEADAALGYADWLKRLGKWTLGILALLFGWRNREHIFKRGPGYLSRLAHALFGPKPAILRRKQA